MFCLKLINQEKKKNIAAIDAEKQILIVEGWFYYKTKIMMSLNLGPQSVYTARL